MEKEMPTVQKTLSFCDKTTQKDGPGPAFPSQPRGPEQTQSQSPGVGTGAFGLSLVGAARIDGQHSHASIAIDSEKVKCNGLPARENLYQL